ncbi:hypothetical protein LTR62_003770 [Meristemomyces frigidus]|uniref:Sterigmatocystin biosynthesis monooxygenase stcW n=1 Tax=Meristemomyces frigidus TaxID=1508187 RepID=A0AAN7YGL2_9PEZI|nr:hypothetical protein LTR62_003770 [Meristemomyces frigidus]
MAPDLNAVSGGGQWDYSKPGSSGYNIDPDSTYNDPNNRKLKVLTIGAGVTGILLAYRLQKDTPNVEHVIYEKNSDIGGTWLENRYPGCACDIPSHAYTYQFALNPDWPRFFSYSPDIWKYLDKVCNTFDLRKYMTFNTEVTGAYWDDGKGEWKVELRETRNGEVVREFRETCHLLLHGTGILNNFKWPDIPGLKDKFKGRVVHTARWPKDYPTEKWADDRVAVIGSGASSIQTVPTMQPHAKHLDIFVRTAVWFVQIANNYGQNKEYDEGERDNFRHNPKALVDHAKDIEDQVNGLWGAFYSDTEAQKQGQELFRNRMAEHIKDERLLKGFTPTFGIGCRRITPGDPYMAAIQKENVDVHFTPVESCTEDGVVGGDGVERKVDTIVCATGFDVSYKPRFPLVGKDGVDLREKWKDCPESYLGLGVPGFPNFMTFIGPTWPVENGSVMGPLHSVSDYAVQIIKKMQNENIKSWTPDQHKTDLFNNHVQEWVKWTVWKEDCRSWYKDNKTGRVNAVWPGSSMHYQQVIASPRYEDFHIEYHDKNPWAHLGMGWTVENRAGPEAADCSPYLSLNNIDPKWYEAIGGDAATLQKQQNNLNAK